MSKNQNQILAQLNALLGNLSPEAKQAFLQQQGSMSDPGRKDKKGNPKAEGGVPKKKLVKKKPETKPQPKKQPKKHPFKAKKKGKSLPKPIKQVRLPRNKAGGLKSLTGNLDKVNVRKVGKLTVLTLPQAFDDRVSRIRDWFGDNGEDAGQRNDYSLWRKRLSLEKAEVVPQRVMGSITVVYDDGEKATLNVSDAKTDRINMPKGLSDTETADFLSAWLHNGLNIPSMAYINTTNLKFMDTDKASLADHKMKGVRLGYKLLAELNEVVIEQRDGYCVPDYLLGALKGKAGFKHWNHGKLTKELTAVGYEDGQGVSVNQLVAWAKRFHTNVSIYPVNPYGEVMAEKHVATSKGNGDIQRLVFLVNNEHLYPITSKPLIDKVVNPNGGRISLCDLKEVKMTVKFSGEEWHFIDDDNLDAFIAGTHQPDTEVFIRREDCGLSMEDIMSEVIRTHKTIDVPFNIQGSYKVDMFKHPKTGQVLVDANEFERRKQACEWLWADKPIEPFKFVNQSWTQIAKAVFQDRFGEVLPSTYNQVARRLLDANNPSPLIQSLVVEVDDPEFRQGVQGLDITKSYTSVMLRNEYHYPRYSIHDAVEDYGGGDLVCGEYYLTGVQLPWATTATFMPDQEDIDEHRQECEALGVDFEEPDPITTDNHILLKAGFYHYGLVKELLKRNYITKDDITHCIKASSYYPADTLKDFAEFCVKTFPENQSKRLGNYLVGQFNDRFSKQTNGCLTNDHHTVKCLISECEDNDQHYMTNEVNGIWLFRRQLNTRNFEDHGSVWRTIICGGILNLIGLLESLPEDSTVIGVQTDCVYYKPGDEDIDEDLLIEERDSDEKEFTPMPLANAGAYHRLNKIAPVSFQYKAVDPVHLQVSRVVEQLPSANGTLFTGVGGSGKTHQLVEMMKQPTNKQPVCLAPTNKAKLNVNQRMNGDVEPEQRVVYAHTFDSYLSPQLNAQQKVAKLAGKVVFVDEFSMVQPHWIELLYQAWEQHHLEVYMFGDPNQLPPVKARMMTVDSPAVGHMMTHQHLPYRVDSGRYDQTMYDALDTYLKTGRDPLDYPTPPKDENNHPVHTVNIVRTNDTRIKINTHFTNALCRDGGVKVEFTYQGKKERYYCKAGMPLIASANYTHKPKDAEQPTFTIANNEQFVLQSIGERAVRVKEIDADIPREVFVKTFVPAYAITDYKCQGGEIDQPYSIWEAGGMTKSHLYVAKSRTTHSSYVHVQNHLDFYPPERVKVKALTPKKNDTVFANTLIYLVSFANDKHLYVGLTTTSTDQRKAEHTADPNSAISKHLAKAGLTSDDVHIDELCCYPCQTLKQANAEELKWFAHYADKVGLDLMLNDKHVASYKDGKAKKMEKRETKVEMDVEKVLTDHFNVLDYPTGEKEGCFRYEYRVGGKKVARKMRYGKKKSKEEAYEAMVERSKKEYALVYFGVKEKVEEEVEDLRAEDGMPSGDPHAVRFD